MPKIRPRRAVDITTDHLRSLIISGEYPADSLLPPERALAEELGVNRLTLRAALARLEAEKLVVPRQGQGIRVQDWRRTGGLSLLSGVDDDQVIVDMLALRRSLAAEAIYGACLHASGEQKRILADIARRQDVTEDEFSFLEGDLAFTRALVAASGVVAFVAVAFRKFFGFQSGVYSRTPDSDRLVYKMLHQMHKTVKQTKKHNNHVCFY